MDENICMDISYMNYSHIFVLLIYAMQFKIWKIQEVSHLSRSVRWKFGVETVLDGHHSGKKLINNY